MAKVDYNPVAPGRSYTMRAGAAIDQYNVVITGTTEGYVVESAGTNELAFGFLHTGKATASGDHVTVYVSGVVWARCSEALSYGEKVQTTADGEVAPSGTGVDVCGISLGVTDAGDELVPVLITLNAYQES